MFNSSILLLQKNHITNLLYIPNQQAIAWWKLESLFVRASEQRKSCLEIALEDQTSYTGSFHTTTKHLICRCQPFCLILPHQLNLIKSFPAP